MVFVALIGLSTYQTSASQAPLVPASADTSTKLGISVTAATDSATDSR